MHLRKIKNPNAIRTTIEDRTLNRVIRRCYFVLLFKEKKNVRRPTTIDNRQQPTARERGSIINNYHHLGGQRVCIDLLDFC